MSEIKMLDLKEIKNKYSNINTFGRYNNVVQEQLKEICKMFYFSKEGFKELIENCISKTLRDIDNTFYGNQAYDFSSGDSFVIVFPSDYKDCLLDWFSDFENHIHDLDILASCIVENEQNCVAKCYLELNTLCRKLVYAMEESKFCYEEISPDIDCMAEIDSKILREAFEYFKNGKFKAMFDIYSKMLKMVNCLGSYLFVYKNEYEKGV